jgi:hypothetical protein
MFFDRLEDGVRVQFDVTHHLGEHIPLNLRKGQKQVFVRQQRVLAPASFLDRPIYNALRGFTYLAG